MCLGLTFVSTCWKHVLLIKEVNFTEISRKIHSQKVVNLKGGWSTGYTAYSILMQLQAFLFDENVPQAKFHSHFFLIFFSTTPQQQIQ
jgi:hypothetical protein